VVVVDDIAARRRRIRIAERLPGGAGRRNETPDGQDERA
jgi:hypothetical protein